MKIVGERYDHRMSEKRDTRVGSEIITVLVMDIVWELEYWPV